MATNPAISVPLPSEPHKPPRFLSQSEVERLVDAMPDQYKAMVLVGAFAGLRWGEAAGLTRASIDVLQSRITVTSTAVEVRGHVTLGNKPKTSRYRSGGKGSDASTGGAPRQLRSTGVGRFGLRGPRGGHSPAACLVAASAAGRHPSWDPQDHRPGPAAQLCGDPGRGWL
jgi:integrase